MEDVATGQEVNDDRQISDDEELIMREVIKGDADLFYLHHYLAEVFKKGDHF